MNPKQKAVENVKSYLDKRVEKNNHKLLDYRDREKVYGLRYEDKKDDIWTTYQRVQENLIKGGLPGRTEKGKRTTTRPVKAIDGDVKLNKALWLIAEKFRTLKG